VRITLGRHIRNITFRSTDAKDITPGDSRPREAREESFRKFVLKRASEQFDPVIRAFDVETGKELWKAQLPTNGHAVPITYQLTAKGKQYVVIAAGSHAKIKEEPLGDALMAFTLP